MKLLFAALYRGTPSEKLDAFIQIESVLPSIKTLDPGTERDFVALGRWVSRFDEWDQATQRRLQMRASAVETHATSAGLVYDENGFRVQR